MKLTRKLLLALSCLSALSAAIDDDLIKAAEIGNTAEVVRLLHRGANASAYHGEFSALSEAARYGHLEIVAELLRQEAVWIKEALCEAARNGHLPIVQLLIAHISRDRDMAMLWRKNLLNRALINAAIGGHVEIIKFIFSLGVHNDATDLWHRITTALIEAAKKGHLAATQVIVDHTFEYDEAATEAAFNGHLAVAQFLHDHGAHINNSAIRAAAAKGNLAMINFLVGHGIDIHAADSGGPDAALRAATYRKHPATTQLLLAYGANISTDSVLHMDLESHQSSVSLLKTFVNFRESPLTFIEQNRIGSFNYTHPNQLVLWAVALHQPDALKLLLENHPEAANAAYVTEETGIITALMFAAMAGFEDIVAQLIYAGAEIKVLNKDGNDAMKLAADRGHFTLATNLLMYQKHCNFFR